MKFPWHHEQVSLLRHLFITENLSAGEIAYEISRRYRVPVDRNAVCGKLWRLGLHRHDPRREREVRARAARDARIRAAAGEPPRLPRKDAPPLVPDKPQPPKPKPKPPKRGMTLVNLTDDRCRWPVGHHKRHGWLFCGTQDADLTGGKPYCDEHSRIAYA